MKNAVAVAIRLIREDMRATKESCAGGVGWDWACGSSCVRDKKGKCSTQRNYEKRAACIAELQRLHV